MNKILLEYKRLKAKLTTNVGCEETIDEVGYNDEVIESIENLLKDLTSEQRIKLTHI